jgi:hypothetical protein
VFNRGGAWHVDSSCVPRMGAGIIRCSGLVE